jgi:RimJ/RimL family protein N-acetyltransferase
VPNASFADKPTLRGQVAVLQPVTLADVPRLHELMQDRETTVLTGSTHRSDASDAVEHPVAVLEEVYARWATADDRLVWTVRAAGDDTVLGTEATRLAVDHAFGALGLQRVELEVYAFNPRARHVYEKVGFVLEGTRRQALRFDDGWVDCHVMAMVRSDWQPGPT